MIENVVYGVVYFFVGVEDVEFVGCCVCLFDIVL